MKIVKEGYIGRLEQIDDFLYNDKHMIRLDQIYRFKLRKNRWNPSDWPPKKVRITIEEID